MHPGVYVDHTGPLTWQPAGLGGGAVLVAGRAEPRVGAAGGRGAGPPGPGRVRDPRGRRPVPPRGRARGRAAAPHGAAAERVRWNLGPPRVRYEDAVLDVALDADDRTWRRSRCWPTRAARGARPRAAARPWPRTAPRAATGTWLAGCWPTSQRAPARCWSTATSTRVERPHGLPRGRAAGQPPARGSKVYRDVDYARSAWSSSSTVACSTSRRRQRDRDMERDLDAAIEGRETVRLSYGQVFDRPCSTARKVAAVLPAPRVAGPDPSVPGLRRSVRAGVLATSSPPWG